MRIGLLFGSFNPIHRGHLALAKWVLGERLVDAVWCVVSPRNPLKDPDELADFDDRVKMVQLAITGHKNIRVQTIEENLSKPSYTYNTVKVLQDEYPENSFIILAGSDIAAQLHLWYRSEELKEMVDFLFYPRGQGDVECSEVMKNAPRWDISATDVRAGGCRTMVDAAVWKYIVLNGIYDMKSIENLSSLISQEHSAVERVELLMERGRLYYAEGNFGSAINDFREVLRLDSGCVEASEMVGVCNSILDYRYTDIYNP